jgi:hypothetical protein
LVQILLLHGVGGAKPEADWMKPLNDRLAGMGYPTIVDPPDVISVPSYGHLFGARDVAEPPVTYVKPAERELFQQRLAYAARQKALEQLVRPYAERPDGLLPHLPGFVVNPVAELTEYMRFDDVRRYVENPSVRHAVWTEVLGAVPASGPLIVVAHSLGSVVAAGLLNRLPPGVTVDLLITVASPLSFPRYRAHLKPLWAGFPYGRVMRWMNVYSCGDGICAGRGLADEVHQAFDAQVGVDGAHTLEAYMSHPAVAVAIASVAFPAEQPGPAVPNPPARTIHRSWYPLLLGAAFTCQLSKSLPSAEWRRHRRLEAAREEVARRAVADIAKQQTQRAALIAQMAEQGASFSEEQLSDHPLAAGRHPTFQDLTFGAASLLKGSWTDPELLPLAVGLMLQPLVPPFDIQADSRLRRDALVLTLNVVRDARGNLADQTFAEQVRTSADWAKQRLAEGKGFPWGTVLIASSLALLAVTGVGLAVAAPAGLAGAAVVTSTLAAFGPGGMVGGLLTLGAMTGTAGALGGFGLKAEFDNDADNGARAAAMTAAQTGAELAAEAPETLMVTLTGMLAVVHAQARLGFDSTEAFVRQAVSNALDVAGAECELHRAIAPDTTGTKLWERKVMLLKRAAAALNSLTELPDVEALAVTRRALESGNPPPGVRWPGRPQLERGQD